MNTAQVIEVATAHLRTLPDHIFDVLTIAKPVSPTAAINLIRIISKLSPLLGNLIEYNIVELLNGREEFREMGRWVRQDPGFPDTVFQGSIQPVPGFEIKAWFPLSTEITARFKDSQNHFMDQSTYVALLAWIPEHIVYGRPRILDVCVIEGGSAARARDSHYHNPPDYLVLEPGDTRLRKRNLQQTTTSGYKWQGNLEELKEAKRIVESWGASGTTYQPTSEYQLLLRQLLSRYTYRLDTNFAKIDRIVHPEIEQFKRNVQNLVVKGLTIREWARLCNNKQNKQVTQSKQMRMRQALERYLDITEADADTLVR